MKKIIFAVFLVGILFVAGCTKEVEQPVVVEEEPEDLCPDCDDNNRCTEDICNEGTNYECAYKVITPCCGNGECEEMENNEDCPADCEKQVLSEELQAIVTNQQKIKSYRYTPWGSKVADRIYVKDDKMRYDLNNDKRRDYNNQYDSVYFDLTEKKAWLACIEIDCEERYKTEETTYDDFIMETPLDLIEGVTYKGDILQTEYCDTSKPCNKAEVTFADGKTGFVWLDNFYGFPYKIEKDGKLTEFVTVAVNAVKDEDVNLPS